MNQDVAALLQEANIPIPRINPLTPHKSFKDVYAFVEAVETSDVFRYGMVHGAAKLVPPYYSVREAYRLDLALSRYYGKPSEEDRNKMEANYGMAMRMLLNTFKKPELFFETCEHMLRRLRKKLHGKDMVVVVEDLGSFYLLRDDDLVTWSDTVQTRMPVTAELNAMLGWKDRVEYNYTGERVIKF